MRFDQTIRGWFDAPVSLWTSTLSFTVLYSYFGYLKETGLYISKQEAYGELHDIRFIKCKTNSHGPGFNVDLDHIVAKRVCFMNCLANNGHSHTFRFSTNSNSLSIFDYFLICNCPDVQKAQSVFYTLSTLCDFFHFNLTKCNVNTFCIDIVYSDSHINDTFISNISSNKFYSLGVGTSGPVNTKWLKKVVMVNDSTNMLLNGNGRAIVNLHDCVFKNVTLTAQLVKDITSLVISGCQCSFGSDQVGIDFVDDNNEFGYQPVLPEMALSKCFGVTFSFTSQKRKKNSLMKLSLMNLILIYIA